MIVEKLFGYSEQILATGHIMGQKGVKSAISASSGT